MSPATELPRATLDDAGGINVANILSNCVRVRFADTVIKLLKMSEVEQIQILPNQAELNPYHLGYEFEDYDLISIL